MESVSADLQPLFEGLESAARKQPYPSLDVRLDRLARLKSLLQENELAICEALSADFGYRSSCQSAFADITTTIKSINHSRRHLKYWMQRQRRSPELLLRLCGASAYVESQPKGVIGIISPWNFPINLSLSPLVGVIAAGNVAMIKPSEVTPYSAELLKKLISQYFHASEAAVITGGMDIAKSFTRLPFDHLVYTGGSRIAKDIMRAAADNLVPLTLELGGKSPVLISNSADLEKAAARVAFGKYFNAGQVCIAPDYVLIARSQLDDFLKLLAAAVQKLDSSQVDDDGVSVVNERHQQRISGLVDSAKASAADVITMTRQGEGRFQLTVVISPEEDLDICREEIFGPVLMIRVIDNLSAQLDYINSSAPPLVIYYFGKSKKEFETVARNTRSGALVKNDIIFQYASDDLPFGGVGESGMGKYRGLDGFREFSNQKAFYNSGWLDTSSLVTPPYSKHFKLINKLMRNL